MSRLTSAFGNILLVLSSIGLVFLGLEGFLWVYASVHPGQSAQPAATVPAPDDEIVVPPEIIAAADRRMQLLTMPDSWKRTPTRGNGTARAYYWQGVLHVYNQDGMRWATPFPAKRADVYRAIVVGDSLTYGDGLSEEWRFTNLLDRWMNQEFRIEFLNLGVDGRQSEDILEIINRLLPILKPNLVIYAICLNDFLPSGRPEYSSAGYPFPLPDLVKDFLIRRTRTGAFLSHSYDGALRRLHLRADFFDDILKDFDGYQQRFARDVAEMNRSVRAAGLPPMIGMVVDQYPAYGARGHQIAKIAESALGKAGAVVIPTENYYRRYHAQAMHISRWEAHPNEVANYIWASMIVKELERRHDLEPFKR
jgi:lysophospholipase L1-like esterase